MPVDVLLPTVMVIVELPDPGAGIVLGFKLTVVPDGAPDAERLMELLNCPRANVVIVTVALIAFRDAQGRGCSSDGEVGALPTVNVELGWIAGVLRHYRSR